MTLAVDKLTETQRRIFEVLIDGEAHAESELKTAIWGPEAANDRDYTGTLRVHLCELRKALARNALDITSRGVNGRTVIRLVRHITRGE